MAGTSVFLTPAEPSTHFLEAMMLAAWCGGGVLVHCALNFPQH